MTVYLQSIAFLKAKLPNRFTLHCLQNLPNNIHGACADFWIFTSYRDTGREWAVNTKHNSFGFRRQNG